MPSVPAADRVSLFMVLLVLVALPQRCDARQLSRCSATLSADPKTYWVVRTGGPFTYTSCITICNNSRTSGGWRGTIRNAAQQALVTPLCTSASDKLDAGGDRKGDGVTFRWKNGVEDGESFWRGVTRTGGTCLTYCNWGGSEPNNHQNWGEDFVLIMGSSAGARAWTAC